jgi:uncharacterized protein
MWHDLFAAAALILLMEGIMPFLSPKNWRNTMLKLASGSDKAIRVMGLVSMLLGTIIIVCFVHNG